jgi:hypothetical protein
MQTTRFGAATDSPYAAAALLRATAARYGAPLEQVSAIAAAAAVVATEGFLEVYHRASLESISSLGAAAAEVFAGILQHAANGALPTPVGSDQLAPLEEFQALVGRVDVWLGAWFAAPADAEAALVAAGMLLVRGLDPRLDALGELFCCWGPERR